MEALQSCLPFTTTGSQEEGFDPFQNRKERKINFPILETRLRSLFFGDLTPPTATQLPHQSDSRRDLPQLLLLVCRLHPPRIASRQATPLQGPNLALILEKLQALQDNVGPLESLGSLFTEILANDR